MSLIWNPAGVFEAPKNCNANEYVCGMNAQVDAPNRDNTGMNGVNIRCCKM